MADSTVNIKFTADTGDLTSKTQGAKAQLAAFGDQVSAGARNLTAFGTGMRTAGYNLTLAMAPLIAGGVSVLKTSADFELSLSRIKGLVGATDAEVSKFKQGILDMAPEVGKGPQELAEALYFVTSSGIKAAAAMDVVKVSAQAASAGLGDTKVVADAVTSALLAYGESNISAADATGVLVSTVRLGKAEADAVAGAMGRVIPIAAQLGVSFDQVGAAVASMTLKGVSADEAVTSLRQIMVSLMKPAKQAEDALKSVGLSSQGLRDQLSEKGLLSVLMTLSEAFGTNEEAMAAVFPNVRALVGVFNLAGQNMAQVEDIFNQMATSGAKDLENAFGATQQTKAFKFAQAMAEIKVQMIEIGDAIGPAVMAFVPLLVGIAAAAGAMGTAFAALNPVLQTVIVGFVGALAVAGPLLIVLGSMFSAIGALTGATITLGTVFAVLTGPIGLTILAIVALTAAFILFHDQIETGLNAAIDQFNRFRTPIAILIAIVIGPLLASILAIVAAVQIVYNNWQAIWGAMTAIVSAVFNWVASAAHWLSNAVTTAWGGITGAWNAVWNAIPGPVKSAMSVIGDIVESAINKIIDMFQGLINKMNVVGGAIGGLLGKIGIHIPTEVPSLGHVSFGGLGGMFGGGSQGEMLGPPLPPLGGGAPSPGGGVGGGAGGGLGGGEAGGGASEAITDAEQGLRALRDAFVAFNAVTGGTEDQFRVLLSVTQQKNDMDKRAGDAITALGAAQQLAGDSAYQLKKGLVEVAEYMARTGKTVTEVFREMAEKAKDAISTAFGNVFARPSRETAETNLQIALLQREYDLAKLNGASEEELKRIEERIDRLREENKLRQDDIDVLKAQLDVADQTLRTHQQEVLEGGLYVLAMQTASQKLRDVNDQIFYEQMARYNMINAMQETAAALRSGSIPEYAHGTNYVPRTGLAVVHQGEQIIPAGESGVRASGPTTIHYHIDTINLTGDAEAGLQALAAAVR